MSLINKLLKDLEKRQAYLYQDQDRVLDGLSSAYDLHRDQSKNRPFIISLVLITIFIVAIYWLLQGISGLEVSKLINDNQNDPAMKPINLEQNKSDQSQPSNAIISEKRTAFMQLDMHIDHEIQDEAEVRPKLNILNLVKLYKTDLGLEVKLENSLEIDYFVYNLSEPSRTVIEIENTRLGFPLEALQALEPITAIRYSINENNRLKLVFESVTPLLIDKSVTRQDDEKHLLVVSMNHTDLVAPIDTRQEYAVADLQPDINKVNEDSTIYKGELIKTPSSQKHSLLADKLFKEAYSLYKSGNISNSLRMLNQALDQDAAHINARSTLATILSEQGHHELAYSVLNEGLIQFPDITQWRMVYARLLVKQKNYSKAEQTLAAYQPRVSDNTDYYALYAAVLQKLNDHNQSARLYRDLLHINPGNSIWWMGLGISLESLRRYEDALYAYQKALSYPILVDESKNYVTNRVTALTSLINNESS